MHDDEESLVKRAQAYDQEAFGAIYERYFDKIYRYVAFKIGNSVEAEDLTEEVFVRALESIGKFQFRGVPFSAWLFRIAANLIVDYVRRRARRETTELSDTLPDQRMDPEEEVERKLSAEQVREAVGRLTGLQQQVVTLRFAGELSVAETAVALGKTDGAVKAAQHAALAALHKILTQGRRRGHG